jgi:NADH:ubiquinone oxidoreductase subunit
VLEPRLVERESANAESKTGTSMPHGGWKNFLIEIFAWWRGNTWGTRLWAATQGVYVGSDQFGNRYYRSKKPMGPHGTERRMVIYAGTLADPTTIPPGWYGWMHYKNKNPPTEGDYTPHEWEKPHEPNYTGTARAYRPPGSQLNTGERPRVTGDYDAWSPD